MGAPRTNDLFGIGLDVLVTTFSSVTGFITAQLGSVVSQKPSAQVAEWWQHVGFASRPRLPKPGQKAAQVVCITRADHDAIIASRDDRLIDVLASLDDGETAVFASAQGGGLCIFKKDGTITVTAGAGGAAIKVGVDGSIKLGGASPIALARGDALDQLISIMASFAAGNAVSFGSPLSTSAATIAQLQALTITKTQDTKAT